jgi:hypothetical protein
MHMQLVTQVLGRIMARFLIVYTLIKELLLPLVSNLRVRYILVSLSAVNLWTLLAKILLNFKVLLANLITQAQLIKVGLKHVAITSGQIGQQLLTTVRQILQRVLNLLKQGR